MGFLHQVISLIDQLLPIAYLALLVCVVAMINQRGKQMQNIYNKTTSIDEKIDRLYKALEQLPQPPIQANVANTLRPAHPDELVQAGETVPISFDQWNSLITKALTSKDNSRNEFRKLVIQSPDTHIVGFADPRKRLDDNQYAEFTDNGVGGCLLIPATTKGHYHAFPLPTEGNWLKRHIDILSAVFDIRGNSAAGNTKPSLEYPAYMRLKDISDSKPIYIVVEKGLIRCS